MVRSIDPATPAEPPHSVLIVEDEVLIRLTLAAYLRDCGFLVFEAASGDEAIEVLTATDIDIDIVFSDVQMPGKTDGFALARWVRANRPAMRVLLTSGAAQAAHKAEDLCLDGPLVRKPYDHATLLAQMLLLKERARQSGT